MKRLALAVVVIAALATGVGSALAGAFASGPVTTTVSFATLTHASCSYVPAGTTIDWTGPETSITTVKTTDGVTTISVVSHASGRATDQDGNLYAFDYTNQFRISNTAENPGLFAGTMTDHFSLAGNGLQLNTGFRATFNVSFATDPPTFFNFVPIKSRGDPIDFATLQAHCDPL